MEDSASQVGALIVEALVLASPLMLLAAGYLVGHWVERFHLRSLEGREARLKGITFTDLRHIPRDWNCTAGELVMGQAVIASDYFKTFASGIRNFFGGEVRSLERLMSRARREATVRMLEQAAALGAGSVWCVRYETSTIGRGTGYRKGLPCAEVFVYGTALRMDADA